MDSGIHRARIVGVPLAADAAKLRKVLLLKLLGLKLADIRGFLESDVSPTVLRDILEAQDARLAAELEERTRARARIAAMIAAHTSTARKVTCTHCGKKDWCAEVSRDRLDVQGVHVASCSGASSRTLGMPALRFPPALLLLRAWFSCCSTCYACAPFCSPSINQASHPSGRNTITPAPLPM